MEERTGGKLVMVVDDSPFVRKLVCLIVKELGYRVIEAVDGAQAIEILQFQAPDAIILDVAMPNKGGVETLRELRADFRFQATPVIMLTAEKGQSVVAEVASLRVRGYILKDQPKEMKARLQKFLEGA